ncbi:MAG: oligosaccharide flippase family protein, partial [Novosphingobium sp.]
AEMNLVNVVLGTLTQLVPLAVAIWVTPSLTVILPALYASRLLVLGGFLGVVVTRVTQGWQLTFDRPEARALISFGGWMTLSSLISPILAALDRFLIGSMLGVRQVSHYSVPYQLSERAMFVPSALLQALFPRISGAPDAASARDLSRRGLYAVAALCAPPMIFGTLFMHPFLTLWISRDFAAAASFIGQIILTGFWINALGYACYTHLTAVGQPRLLAMAHVIEIVPYCALLFALLGWLGLSGAAIAFAVRVAADDLLLAHFCGLLKETGGLLLAGTGAFAIAIWLGMGLELTDGTRVIAGLALVALVSGVSILWLAREKQTLLAAMRLR